MNSKRCIALHRVSRLEHLRKERKKLVADLAGDGSDVGDTRGKMKQDVLAKNRCSINKMGRVEAPKMEKRNGETDEEPCRSNNQPCVENVRLRQNQHSALREVLNGAWSFAGN